MAVTWGPWSSDNRFRAGIEIIPSPSSIGAGTSSQTLTIRSWMQSRYNLSEYSFGNNWFITGSSSASGQTDYNLGAMGTKLMGQTTLPVATSYTSTTKSTFTSRIHRNASPGAGLNASVSASYTTQKRPYTKPSAPSGVVFTRNSDTQATLTWTRHATTGAPYTSQTVQMRRFSGDAWGAWGYTATVSAGATSWVRPSLYGNVVWQARIRANNTAGSSAYADSTSVWMTPASPANVDSSVNSSGNSITTTWDERAYLTSPRVTYSIDRSVNGGAWSNVASGLIPTSGSPGNWTDSSPGGGNNQYRVRAYISIGGLYSAWVNGDIVSTVVPPLAPSNLSPNGQARDLNNDQTLTWKYNPGLDKAKQSGFVIQISANGGSTWVAYDTGPKTGTTSSFVLPAGTLANGQTYLWRSKTIGVTSAGYGSYSAPATITGSTTPTLTFEPDYPADPTVQLPLEARWAYQQDELSPQTQWEAVLYTAGSAVESRSGTTEDGVIFAYPVEDGETYAVQVRVRSGDGIWSDWFSAVTTIDLPSPAAALVEPEYDPCSGTMILHITAEEPVDPLVAVDYVVVERRVDGGDWVTLSDHFVPDADLLDLIPSTTGLNEYRLTSVSGAPSYFVNPIVEAYGGDGRDGEQWVLLAYGDGFGSILRFHGDPKITDAAGRNSDVIPLLGRKKPLAVFGQNTERIVTASGSLYFDQRCEPRSVCGYDSSPLEWVTAAQEAEIVSYRDFEGRRLFGELSGLGTGNGETLGVATLSFTVTETDFVERYGTPPEDEPEEP